MKKIIVLVGTLVIATLLTGAGCNLYQTSKTDNGTGSRKPNSVSISNLQFSPATLTIVKGTTVTWTNNESSTHTVTADDKSFDSGNLTKGKTFQFTFDKLGTFSYRCSIHSAMTGKIIVQ